LQFHRHIQVNPALCRITGFTEEDLLGAGPPHPYWAPEAYDEIEKAFKDTINSRFETFEFIFMRKNGDRFPVLVSPSELRDESGGITGYFALIKDISGSKEAEERLKTMNEELQRSNQDLEQFAYVASHDLQEPLRMVSSFTQLLADRYDGLLDDRGREFIGFAVDGAARMQHLIHDLLAYSRVTTRAEPLAPLSADVPLGEAMKNLQASILETGALVTSGELPPVLADRTQLMQLFLNLIGNAIKFRKPGEAPRVNITAEPDTADKGFVRVTVSENGIGIDPAYSDRIFVIFQRLHTRKEYPGTGIGLALCKRIVYRHGGKIWLESLPGKGSAFCFTLKTANRKSE